MLGPATDLENVQGRMGSGKRYQVKHRLLFDDGLEDAVAARGCSVFTGLEGLLVRTVDPDKDAQVSTCELDGGPELASLCANEISIELVIADPRYLGTWNGTSRI